ncbi:MAG: hypothetical protein ACI3XI_06605 [Eubacteriales bacterium]
MKKILAIALCVVMVLAAVACTPTVTEKEYKLGMGIVVSTASSKTGTAQVDATVAAVVLDAEGKIVAARIDVAQNKMTVTDGAVDTAKVFESKRELGDRYGMAGKVDNNGDGVMLEWYEQVNALETYLVGKTVAEVEAMTTQEVNAHNISTDEALLTAGCTMDIVAFRDAVVKACKDDQAMTFKTASDFTVGVAVNTTAAESTAATADAEGVVKMYSDFAASVIVDGKIVASLNDAIQPQIKINAAGEITGATFSDTKRGLKEDYNMAKYGASMDNDGDGRVLEWYVQSEAFSKFVVGMTGAEVEAMTTKEAGGHQISDNADLLSAGCTIQITGIKAVVAKSVTNAR